MDLRELQVVTIVWVVDDDGPARVIAAEIASIRRRDPRERESGDSFLTDNWLEKFWLGYRLVSGQFR